MCRAQTGDLEAYEALVRLHTPLAHRTAVLLGGGSDADDIVQEAFVRAYQALPRFRSGEPFRPWLLRIVRNLASNARRSARRRTDLAARATLAASSGRSAHSPEEAVLAATGREALWAAVRALPDRLRMVVVCRYLLDLSEAETATVLGIPRGTAKSRLSRALARLRQVPLHGAEEVSSHG